MCSYKKKNPFRLGFTFSFQQPPPLRPAAKSRRAAPAAPSPASMMVVSGGNPFAKEMAIRKRIASLYAAFRFLSCFLFVQATPFFLERFNKREDDFPSLKDYNDYLEEVEDMTFNLIDGNDVEAIEAKIAKYQEENAEQIIIARARKAEELAAALKASKGPVQTETTDLGTGQSSQTAGSGTGLQGQYAPTALPGAGLVQPRPTGMVPQPMPIGGPSDPHHGYTAEDEEGMKLRAERAARAGGWTVDLSRKRALEEAFSSIWI